MISRLFAISLVLLSITSNGGAASQSRGYIHYNVSFVEKSSILPLHHKFSSISYNGIAKMAAMNMTLRYHETFKQNCMKENDIIMDEVATYNYDHLPAGASKRLISCTKRGTLQESGLLTMCNSCIVKSSFSQLYFPRETTEVYCGLSSVYCLSGGGSCQQDFTFVPFKFDLNEVGRDKMDEWPIYDQQINTGCSCEIIDGTPFAKYV